MISVELQSVQVSLPAPNSSSVAAFSPSIRSLFFIPFSSSVFDPTSLTQTCFAFSRLATKQNNNNNNVIKTNATKISLLPFAEFDAGTISYSLMVPENGNVITQNTKLRFSFESECHHHHLQVGADDKSNAASMKLDKIIDDCPWISSLMMATLREFLSSNDETKNGLIISGPPKSGKKTLARSVSSHLSSSSSNINTNDNFIHFDCLSFAELCILHAADDGEVDDFSPQVVVRNVINQWFSTSSSSSVLFLENLDFFDVGGSIRDKTGGGSNNNNNNNVGKILPSSISEKIKRIFWLEFSRAFRKASSLKNQQKYFWIATVSNESNLGSAKMSSSSDGILSTSSPSVFSRWFSCIISLPDAPEFSQRLEIFRKFCSRNGSNNDHDVDEMKIKNQLVIPTAGYSLGEIYERCGLTNKMSMMMNIEETATRIKQQKDFHNKNGENKQEQEISSIPKVFGMNDDLAVIEDSCVRPLCQVAKELKDGTRNFSTSSSSSSSSSNIFLPKGILVVGPPGCGKSHLLKHLSSKITHGSSGGVAVILQDTLSLVQKEVGVTELNIHNLFERARSRAPCVLLLDHIDSIAAPRNSSTFSDSSSQVADRMLSTLLIEMDGVKKSERDKFVIVVATAPSLEKLDPAVRRPGRLDIHVEVKYPGEGDIFEMLKDGLLPTYSELKNDVDVEAKIDECIRIKAKQLLNLNLDDEDEQEETERLPTSYADVQSWYREKVSKLVSRWLLLNNNNNTDNDDESPSFKSFEEWKNWMLN